MKKVLDYVSDYQLKSACKDAICRVGFDGGTGDVSWSLDFGIPPTGDESDVPGWDAFDPPHWSKLWG